MLLHGQLAELDRSSFHDSGDAFLLYFTGHETLKTFSNVFFRDPAFDIISSVVLDNLAELAPVDAPEVSEVVSNCDLQTISDQTYYSFPP